MSMKQRTRWIAGLVLSAGASSGAMAALYGFGPAELWTEQQLAQLVATINAAIAQFGTSMATQLQWEDEQVLSALAVATKQEAVSANSVASTIRNAAQQFSTAVNTQNTAAQVAKAYVDYASQGYDPCGTYKGNAALDATFSALPTTAVTTMAAQDMAPGSLVDSVPQAMAKRLADHRSQFCTASEAAAGACSVSINGGADTNAALLFEPVDAGSPESAARKAYMQNVLGEPDGKIPASAGSSAAGQSYLLASNRKQSLVSIPQYSLAMIDAANTRVSIAGGTNQSPNETMKARVNQYFGGPDALKWSESLAGQSSRGLLVEATKISGLETWMHYKQYEQNQRLMANLAALVLATGDRARDGVEVEYRRTQHDAITGSVK